MLRFVPMLWSNELHYTFNNAEIQRKIPSKVCQLFVHTLQKHCTLSTHFTLCENIAHFAKKCTFCTQHTTLSCTHFANTFLICCLRATLPPLICLLAIYKIFKGFNIHTQKAYIIALILQALLSCMSEHKHTDTDTKKHSKHMLFIFQAIFLMFLVLVPLISFEHLTACNEAWENLFSSLNLLK